MRWPWESVGLETVIVATNGASCDDLSEVATNRRVPLIDTIGNDAIMAWLLEGDPSIRWQVLRDLADAPRKVWEAERRQVQTVGWGAHLLEQQDPEGTWGQSLYGCPRWTCTTYTLLLLRDMGLANACVAAARGCRVLLDRGIEDGLTARGKSKMLQSLQRTDTCVVGMWLSLGAYFGLDDPKLEAMVEYLLDEQMSDGGWNCRRKAGAVHSSLHTTLNVLDAVRNVLARGIGPASRLRSAQARAIEFILMHRLYLSDRTGRVIDEAFTQFSFPPRWHYDVLRGLDYLMSAGVSHDRRLKDAYDLLLSRRRQDGLWPLQNRHPGKVFFQMEPTGRPSRWNTLRALRCLRHWRPDASGPSRAPGIEGHDQGHRT